jgi:hypothetical protein
MLVPLRFLKEHNNCKADIMTTTNVVVATSSSVGQKPRKYLPVLTQGGGPGTAEILWAPAYSTPCRQSQKTGQ